MDDPPAVLAFLDPLPTSVQRAPPDTGWWALLDSSLPITVSTAYELYLYPPTLSRSLFRLIGMQWPGRLVAQTRLDEAREQCVEAAAVPLPAVRGVRPGGRTWGTTGT